jgi:hypothetical protein
METSRRRIHIQKLIVSGGLPDLANPSETVSAESLMGRCIICGNGGQHRILWRSQIIKEPLLRMPCFSIWLTAVKPAS